MATSSTEIANLAISHLGMAKTIGNLDTETSSEASVCRTFYETVRDATLRDFPWPFATKFAALGLIEEDPNEEWEYSYRMPSDCLRFRKILSGTRNDTEDTREPYKVGRDATGLLVFADKQNAEAEYTIRETDVARFSMDFVLAMSLRLSYYIAPRITRGDPFKMQEKVMNNYMLEISRAESTSVNEEQLDAHPDSEFIRARG